MTKYCVGYTFIFIICLRWRHLVLPALSTDMYRGTSAISSVSECLRQMHNHDSISDEQDDEDSEDDSAPRRNTRSRTMGGRMNNRSLAPVDPFRRTRAAGPVQGLRLFCCVTPDYQLLLFNSPTVPVHLIVPKRCASPFKPVLSGVSAGLV